MKYKKRLFVPTLISTTLLSTGLAANADEVDESADVKVQTEETVKQNEKVDDSSVENEDVVKDSSKVETEDTENIDSQETLPAESQEASNGENPAVESTPDPVTEETNEDTDTYNEDVVENNSEFDDSTSHDDNLPPEKENTTESHVEHGEIEETVDPPIEENQNENNDTPAVNNQNLENDSEESEKSEDHGDETENNSTENMESEEDSEVPDTEKPPEDEEVVDTPIDENQSEDAVESLTAEEQNLEKESEEEIESTKNDDEVKQNKNKDRKPENDLKEQETEEQIDNEEPPEDEEQVDEKNTELQASSKMASFDASTLDVNELPYHDNVVYAAKVRNDNNSGRFSPVSSDTSKPLGWLENRTLFITAETVNQGEKYYRVHSGVNGPMQGWVKEEDLSLFEVTQPQNHNQAYDIRLEGHHLLTDPWGSANQYINRLDHYGDNQFHSEHAMDLGAHTYYYGQIGNDKGWVEKSRLVDTSTSPYYNDNVFHAARVNNGENSGRYSPITSNDSKELGWLENRTLFVTSEAKYQGSRYYKIHSGIDGPMQGWVKSEDLRLFNTEKPTSHEADYAIHLKGHHLLTDPWGTANQYIKRLGDYGDNAIFSAEKSMKLGNHTYFYGQIGNDYGWLEQSRVKDVPNSPPSDQEEITTVQYDISLQEALDIQMNLSTPPQAWVNGGGWRNATRSEVSQFLDTSDHRGGAWDYTFLNLDQNQGISASVLNNNLLGNRGILTNQGSAFTQASQTHGVNEVYLISHAILETGHGQSQLAQGVRLDSNGNLSNNGTKYYNMYGVGAVDNNALLGGARYAQQMGWDTPQKAIIGGANFVAQNYFARGQNTLYSMRWNPNNPGSYQYATDINWAYATANNIKNYYDQLGITGRYFTRHEF